MSGTLYVCGTPIGNLKDITLRCLETLEKADIIAAEDTRHTLKLLNHYNIKKKLESYHEHNKDTKGNKILKFLQDGKNIALVSDAGMPTISDPGKDLVELCHQNNINVTVIPGATAFVSAISISGLRSRSFCFEGFLPSTSKQRKEILNKFKFETRTIILYESPHNLIATLNDLYSYLGNRKIAVVREITKKHESIRRGNLFEILNYFKKNSPKGEIVIIIEGVSQEEIEGQENCLNSLSIEEHFQKFLSLGYDQKEAMKIIAKERKMGKREIYKFIKIKK